MSAVLCDLDGLLIDSEELHFQAYKTVFAEYGIDLTLEMFVESWLTGNRYGTRYYLNKVGATSEEEFLLVRDRKNKLYCKYAKGKLKLLPGVKEFLEKVKAAGLKAAIGTGGYRGEYQFAVEECGLGDYFQAFVGGDEVEHNKPAPDIFLSAAKQLGVSPENCVVFENSDIGMNAGLRAGMRCIIVPSHLTKHLDFTGATAVLPSLTDVDLTSLFQN